jgi:glycosyltransferase involved in cell wall biosynthesis
VLAKLAADAFHFKLSETSFADKAACLQRSHPSALKIAHILLTSHFAGSERYVVDLANAQSKDHDVTVILHQSAAQQRPDALAHRFAPEVRQRLVGGKWLWTRLQVRKVLQMLEPDIAHGHLSGGCRSLKGMTIKGARIATLHIHYKAQQHSDLDGLIAIAPWQMDAVPDDLRSRTCQIDNWTRPERETIGAREALRRQWGIGDDEYLIGALGRVEPSKGMDVLVRASQRLNLRKARLVIVGAGSEWQRLRRLAPSSVIMPGFAEKPADCLAAFDAFVSSARSEPFGFVLLEAMASGLPVLATASQGSKHLADFIHRPLLPCDDEIAMAAGLQQLLEHRPPRQAYDLSAYQLDAKVKQIEACYRECLSRKRQPQP